MTERFMLLFIKAISLRRFTGKHLECSFKKKKNLVPVCFVASDTVIGNY